MSDPKLVYKFSRRGHHKDIPGVYMKKPKIIGLVENDGVQLKTTNKMKYFKMPKDNAFPLNLNSGFENYKARSSKQTLNVVSFFVMNPHKLNRTESVEAPTELSGAGRFDGENEFGNFRNNNVITNRSTLALLMQTPDLIESHVNVKWTILATKDKNKLYLSKVEDETQQSRGSYLHNSYHYKFRQYCFSDDPSRDPDSTVPINEEEQIYCIYKTQLLNFNIIYSAEINGIISENKLENMQDFDALERCRFANTNLMPDRCRYWMNNFRLCRWWIKAYLARVDDVYVGLKTEDGLVKEPVKHLLTKELPEGQKWSPKVCVNFVYTFIKMVLQEMRDVDDPEKCFEFNFSSLSGCIYVHVNERPFLAEDFVNFLKKAHA